MRQWTLEGESAYALLRDLGFKPPRRKEGGFDIKPAEELATFLKPLFTDPLTYDAVLRCYADRVLHFLQERAEGTEKQVIDEAGHEVLCDPQICSSLNLPDAELGALVREIILKKGMQTLQELAEDS